MNQFTLAIILSLFLQSCVGFTGLTQNEGVLFKSEMNTYKPEHFKSILHGYSSIDENDPGNEFVLLTDPLQLTSNCKKETVLSFIPSFVVPLPPLIPLFYSDDEDLEKRIKLTLKSNSFELVSISVNKKNYLPTLIDNNEYSFNLNCSDIKGDSEVTIKNGNQIIKVKLQYLKTYNYGWVWMSA